MSIELYQIDLHATDYIGKTALDFQFQQQNLTEFYPHSLREEKALIALSEQKEQFKHRQLLVSSLKKQYTEAGIDLNNPDNSEVRNNIDLLGREKTCTATTGQQIHVFLGPVFVWYKILSVLAEAKRASEITGVPVVPVFWMASEDHDLEEINHVQLYGQTYTWNTNQSGPVGRMNCDLLPELADQLLERTKNDPDQQSFLSLCKKHYSQGLTFSQATRNIVHELFKDQGLIILDADQEELKSIFIPVLREELEHQTAWNLVSAQNNRLSMQGYPIQVNPREINLFYLKEQKRERIQPAPENKSGYFIQGQAPESPAIWIEKLEKSPKDFSPNAILRPVYQEIILPNLIYVCGGSELAYWMQLSDLFKQLDVTYPVLSMRSHALIVRKKVFQKLSDILPIEFFFLSDSAFKDQLLLEKQSEILIIEQHLEKLENEITTIREHIEQSFLSQSISWKEFSEHSKHVEQLKKVIKSGVDAYFSENEFMNSALRQKEKIFSGQKQERKAALFEWISALTELKGDYQTSNISGFFNNSKFNLLLTE